MSDMETRWLHNPLKDDKTLFFGQKNGIMVEHMRRPSGFNMKYNHFHQEYEIYLLLDGRRMIFIDNRSYLMQKGDLMILDSSQIHMSHGVPEDENSEYERIILYIPKYKVEEYDRMFPELKMGEFMHKNNGIYNLSIDQIHRMREMLDNVRIEIDNRLNKGQTMIDLEIIKFFISFWREKTPITYLKDKNTKTSGGKYAVTYAVSDYISEHFCEEISLEKLAGDFFVSKSYLSRSFKEVAGVGITEYVNMLRIQKAQVLLEKAGLSVSEISEQLGFDNISYFGRVFKQHLGISPVQYRREMAKRQSETRG